MTIIIVLLAIILILAAFIVWKLEKPSSQNQSILMLQQQLEGLRTQMSDSLLNNTEAVNKQMVSIIEQVNNQLNSVTSQVVQSQKSIGERLDTASRVVADVQKGVGALAQASERIWEVGKDISSLHTILSAPKLRGGLGELLLGDLLSQVLPEANFELQKKFKSGETVDAVIHLGQGMVPVDAKFPLENFRRLFDANNTDIDKKSIRKKFISDVKKHIDNISSKYILPDEGTFDFALMYIPAENIYYETIIKDESASEDTSLSSYALNKKVIPVSPGTIYAYMQSIVLGLRGMRIEESAQEIIKQIARLKGDFERFLDDFDVLGRHITNAKVKYDDSAKRIEKFGNKLLKTGEEIQEEPS